MRWEFGLLIIILYTGTSIALLHRYQGRVSVKALHHGKMSRYFGWLTLYVVIVAGLLAAHVANKVELKDVIGLGILYLLPIILGTSTYGMVLSRTKLFCPHCAKYVAHNCVWQCGLCDTQNSYSFFDECAECNREPEAYICHHCQTPILFTDAKEVTHPARKPSPPPIPVMEDEAKKQFEKEKERRERDILLTRLDTELAQVTAQKDLYKGKEKKDKRKLMEDDFEEHRNVRLAMLEIVKRETAFAKEAFKDDPEMMERYLESVQEWKEKYT